MDILDGAKVAHNILTHLRQKTSQYFASFGRPPGLCFILVGYDSASQIYVGMKKKRCEEVGIFSKIEQFDENVTEKELLDVINRLNHDPAIDGIIVQQPLPPHIDIGAVVEAISVDKDVDGFHPMNVGRLCIGKKNGFIPCTPKGIHRLLLESHLSWSGQHVVIIGRSNLVGKPLSALLMQKTQDANATVTVVHGHTKNLHGITLQADILVAAMGKPCFVKASMVKKGSIVVDVGINRYHEAIVGDVDFNEVAPLVSHITPVPGGIGPMTIAMLLENTVWSFERKHL